MTEQSDDKRVDNIVSLISRRQISLRIISMIQEGNRMWGMCCSPRGYHRMLERKDRRTDVYVYIVYCQHSLSVTYFYVFPKY